MQVPFCVYSLKRPIDQVVESCVEGIKKPEQAIFDLTLSKLDVKPHEAVFLDDLGNNLKTARLMGISTIKVSPTCTVQ